MFKVNAKSGFGNSQFYQSLGLINLNRAIDGDVVVVRPLGRVSLPSQETLEACDVEGFALGEQLTKGEIVAVTKRSNASLSGSLLSNSPACPFAESENFALFSPNSRKFPDIWIYSHKLQELSGKRIVVTIDSWPEYSTHPIGHCVKVLGNIGDPEIETQILLAEYGVASEDFSTEVMACLPPKDWAISEADLVGRTDFRHIPVVSIDPPGCKDIDDALHCTPLPNGRFHVGVHIAGITQ